MQSCLFLLTLLGQCCLFKCALYEYHFVNKKETWEDARSKCTKDYTNLATVYDVTDIDRLLDRGRGHVENKAWIGLYNQTASNRTWHWSLPGVQLNGTRWASGEPNDLHPGQESCVSLHLENQSWWDDTCDVKRYKAICLNEHRHDCARFNVTAEQMTWSEAQDFCRQHHTDLISGLRQLDAMGTCNVTSERHWIGLFSDTWVWSDNSSSSFRHWVRTGSNHESYSEEGCTLIDLNNSGKWSVAECDQKNSFFCYKDKTVLIHQKKTWQDALDFCRDEHDDLVSITDRSQQIYIQDKAKKAGTEYIWLGMRYTCTLGFWFWVSGERVSYKNWEKDPTDDLCYSAVAMETRGDYQWVTKNDTETFNFICVSENHV